MELVVSVMALCVLGLYALWVFYLAWTNLERAEKAGQMSLPARILGAPVIWTGLFIDAVVNITIASLVFCELPREWLVTHRLERHLRGPDSWRKSLSKFICSHLLDSFDPSGRHCDIDKECKL